MNSVLQTAAPDFSLDECEALVCEWYGIAATARPLTSERDQNFHLRTSGGAEFVFKVANASECEEVIAFQNAVMCHLEASDSTLPAPHVVPTRNGLFNFMKRGHICRMLTFRTGRLMHQVERTSLLRRSLGQAHARLSRALASFRGEAPPGELLWDLKRAQQLRPLLKHINASERKVLLKAALDRFEAEALPWLAQASAQVIHNDLNPHNVVIDDGGVVSGVIDFGDMVSAPLVCDVAVAAAYHVRHDQEPLVDAMEYVDAFCAERPLLEEEISLLPTLIAMRLAMTVLITNWRAELYPENKVYILRNEPNAWRGLAAIAEAERLT
ncbi:MAG: phosphotransferase [Caulobacterales bacterium]|nr:phosphotransferase [Caulobacterales bacterium]